MVVRRAGSGICCMTVNHWWFRAVKGMHLHHILLELQPWLPKKGLESRCGEALLKALPVAYGADHCAHREAAVRVARHRAPAAPAGAPARRGGRRRARRSPAGPRRWRRLGRKAAKPKAKPRPCARARAARRRRQQRGHAPAAGTAGRKP